MSLKTNDGDSLARRVICETRKDAVNQDMTRQRTSGGPSIWGRDCGFIHLCTLRVLGTKERLLKYQQVLWAWSVWISLGKTPGRGELGQKDVQIVDK